MALKLMTQQIEFEMTNLCNARCLFCPRHDPRPKGFISWETLKAGVDLAKAAGINKFKISGFGEPLLHPKLVQFLIYIRSEIPAAVILLITNVSLLKPELFEQLAAIPINQINLSVNGYDKESYESLMAGLKYETVMENLKQLAVHNKGRVDLRFTPVLSKAFGKNELEKMKALMIGLGFSSDNFKFQHVITSRSGKLKDEKLLDREFFEALGDQAVKDGSRPICLRHISNLFVGWDGKIHICCNDIYGEAVVGEIKDLKTADELRKLEGKILTLRADLAFDVCRKCDRPSIAPRQVIGGRTYTQFS